MIQVEPTVNARRGFTYMRRLLRCSSTLRAAFDAERARSSLKDDPTQLEAVSRLAAYASDVAAAKHARSSLLRPWAYLWGGVGSGKTMLLDVFHRYQPDSDSALRAHYHDFMLQVHGRLHALQTSRGRTVQLSALGTERVYKFDGGGTGSHEDTMAEVARQLAFKHNLLCLDELTISDPADALMFSSLGAACH